MREAKRVRVRVRMSKRRGEREKEKRERGNLCVPKSRSDFQMHLCNEQGGWVGWVASLGR